MKNYIAYDQDGKIQRIGVCSDDALKAQALAGESVMEGVANDISQKIVQGKIVNKTSQEIEADKPPVIAESKLLARITVGQYQSILDRISVLENEV